MTRRRLATRDLVALFGREGGTCHLCKQPVQVGQQWDVSHEIPLELGGADDESNWRIAHRTCHREHTAKVDTPMIAKAKRREAAHIAAKVKPRQTIPRRPKPVRPPKDKLDMPGRRALYRNAP